MDNVVGVYICSGCSIGEAFNTELAEKVATNEFQVKLCKTDGCLCSEQAVSMIKSDIESEGLNKVIVAACSPRVMTNVFDFGNDIVLERINYREQLAWCHKHNDEDTDMLAEDMMRMGIVKAQKTSPLEPFVEEGMNKDILVVGGGLAGMRAALTSSKLGYNVIMIEKEDELGGWGAKQFKGLPIKAPFTDPIEPIAADMIDQVTGDDKITVKLGTTITEIKGQPGKFEVTLANGDTFPAGAIVQATGANPYDPSKLGHLGYGESADVITQTDFEKMAKEGQIQRPSNGTPAKNIVFLQCAGSRDPEHLPYCSSICCAESLKQASIIRKMDQDSQVFIVYRDMRTPGQYELLYKNIQDDPGVFLTKGDVAAVHTDNGQLTVDVENTLFGEPINIEADLLVLANGMVPSAAEGDILNLAYRQGKDLPEAKYGFPDSEFICFPYETRRTGIYTAGTVRQPMTEQAALDDASGAALKAIQALELLSQGKTVHPRAMDFSFPDFFMQRCTQCKRCTEECPFGALDEDAKGTPLPNPNRCRRCGICLGACPERIISFKNYSVEIISSMIKSIEMPDEEDEKPRVLCLVCENDAYPTLDLAGLNKLEYSPFVRFIPVRCLGSVNIVWIADSLSAGFDGVILIGCKHGDDYQCHMVKGSELANTRMNNVQEKLQQLALESERVAIKEIGLTDYDKIPEIIEEFMETIEEVGPNPYKDL